MNKKSRTYLLTIIMAGLFFTSCSNEAENKYNEIISIIGKKHNGGCIVGKAQGTTVFYINGTNIKANTSIMSQSANEVGNLVNFELKKGGTNNTYIIYAEWENKNVTNVTFRLEDYGKKKPNTIYLALEGASNWQYFTNIKLSSKDYQKFLKIMRVNSSDNKVTNSKQDAINYNDKIIEEESAIIDEINVLETEFSTYDPSKIESALDAALLQVTNSIEIVEGLDDFDGSSEFKDQTLEFFKMFENQLEEDYAEMLEIYKLPADQYTTDEENRYNEIMKKIDDEYQPQFKEFTDTQDAFAAKYGFTLN